jgi:Ca-activated chloride channel family protein
MNFSRQKMRCISNIPNIAFLHPVEEDTKPPVLMNLSLSGSIHNSAASLSYKQVFKNESDKSIECVYKFPSDRFFAVTALKVKVGDREIHTEIMEKKQAEEKYDDAVAAGHTAVKLNFDEKLPDVIELNIGHLLPGTTAEVTVDIV